MLDLCRRYAHASLDRRCRVTVGGIPVKIEVMAGLRDAQVWPHWIEQYRTHRAVYFGAYWTWTPNSPFRLVASHSRGRLEYTTPRDFQCLVRLRRDMTERLCAVRDSIAQELVAIARACPSVVDQRWQPLAFEFDVPAAELAIAIGEAQAAPARLSAPSEVYAALEACDELAVMNPVIRAWELWQVLQLWEAGLDLVTDTMADLIRELDHLTPAELSFAAQGEISARQVAALELNQRLERGLLGDPRRCASQWGQWSRAERMWSKLARTEADRTRPDAGYRYANGLPLLLA